MDELQAFIAEKQEALDQLTAERTSIQNKMRRANPEAKESLRQQKTEKTASITTLREQLKLAKSVEARSFHMQETLDLVYDNELKQREQHIPEQHRTQRSYER
jgi:DNA-binding transcriptional regulator YiaG